MIIEDTPLEGCKLVLPQRLGDARGYFARTFCAREFAEAGLAAPLAQASVSFNAERGTLRGLHYQRHPRMEGKLVRCHQGAIFDVMVDLRIGSPTFGRWYGAELSAENGHQLFSEPGFAHGFQALSDNVIVGYHITEFYEAGAAAGVRSNDPDIGVAWPLEPTNQSGRDLELPLLSELEVSGLMSLGSPG